MAPLDDIKTAYLERLRLRDDDILLVDVLISTYVANLCGFATDPVWLKVVAPPGTGKSEALLPFKGYDASMFISELTENSLMSGYRGDDGKDPSLILQLHNKILIWKDMTKLITDTPARATKVLGDLRDAYDGYCSKASGTAGPVEYTAKFGLLAAVTPVIDAFDEEHQQLGERFLSFRMFRYRRSVSEDIAHLQYVLTTTHNKTQWQEQLQFRVQQGLNAIRRLVLDNKTVDVTEGQQRTLAILAHLLAQLRTTPVGTTPVEAECAARVVQQFLAVAKAHAVASGRHALNDDDIILVKRLVIDTLTLPRRRLLIALYDHKNSAAKRPLDKLGALTHTPSNILSLALSQYSHTGVVLSDRVGQSVLYYLNPHIRGLLDEVQLMHRGPHIPLTVDLQEGVP